MIEVPKKKKRMYPPGGFDQKAHDKLYYEKNKAWLLKKNGEYKKHRYNTDIKYRLACRLRSRITRAMKVGSKSGSAVHDLGCSIPEFQAYIAGLFWPGMSWENYGKWHLDHILPLSKFDLTDREQFLKACHYTNIQPLWATDNLKKNASVLK